MGSGGGAEETLVEKALRVLNTADPVEKARLGDEIAEQWLKGDIKVAYDASKDIEVPDRPARLGNVKLVSPGEMPKLGKAGSLQSRQALVHSLVHTESWAIDLSWAMPRDFFTDFVKVAQDEGRHFTLLAKILEELGSFYGALPAHDGLWDSAAATSKDLLARLAVEHCVHELDLQPLQMPQLMDLSRAFKELFHMISVTLTLYLTHPALCRILFLGLKGLSYQKNNKLEWNPTIQLISMLSLLVANLLILPPRRMGTAQPRDLD